MKATTAIFINKNCPNSEGECSITIRVTFQRKKKYYPTGISLTVEDFRKALGERPRGELKTLGIKMRAFEQKAYEIIRELPIFDWGSFEKRFYGNNYTDFLIEEAYKSTIDKLKKEDRFKTALSYQSSINNILRFKKNLKFQDVTLEFLKSYEKNALAKGIAKTTIGVYLRPLRTIFNLAISDEKISKDIYPFGPRRYSIPTSRNFKRALADEQIKKIIDYIPKSKTEEKFQNYWLFLYLANGMNIKDMCLLRWRNVNFETKTISFAREKTKNTTKVEEKIQIYILPELEKIIQRWGSKSKDNESFLFPELSKFMTKENEFKKIGLVTKNMNKYLLRIGHALGLDIKLTTVVARHSFATKLMNKGLPIKFIGSSLGHTDIKTTQNYLSSFNSEIREKAAFSLLDFN